MRPSAILIAVSLVAACGTADDGAQTSTVPEPSTSSTGAPTSSLTPPTTPEMDMDLEQQAIADLAARLAVPVDDIETVRVETVTWPDGSLGCPKPGEMYTQALVEGHRIILGHDERVFLYHSGGDEPPFLCQSDDRDGGYDFVPPPGFDES